MRNARVSPPLADEAAYTGAGESSVSIAPARRVDGWDVVMNLVSEGIGYERRRARRLGLTGTDLFALHLLQETGHLGPTALGRRLGLRSSSVTAVLDRLERAALITRYPDPSDRRRSIISPSSIADASAVLGEEAVTDDVRDVWRRLSSNERLTISWFVAKVTELLADRE